MPQLDFSWLNFTKWKHFFLLESHNCMFSIPLTCTSLLGKQVFIECLTCLKRPSLNISNDSISAPHAAAAGKNILSLKYTRCFQRVVSKIWTLCAIYLVPLPILYCHYSKPLPVSPYPAPPSLYLTLSVWLCQLPGRGLKASRHKLFQLPDWWPPAFLLKLSFPLLSEESIFLLLLFQVNPST